MSPRFFVDRPVFATVLSLVILIAGLAAMRVLPVEQYPQIVPPQVVVSATYPGASAEVAAGAVAAPIEQQINGVEGMLYMESTSSSTGAVTITVTFQIGTNADQAAINVNNRVQRALASLPGPVVQQGVVVSKQSSSILAVVTMSSPNRRYDALFISNYALLNVVDELDRTPGVGDAKLFGEKDYSMRVWLKPDRLARFGLTPGDVAAAIREQNAQFTAGRIGDEPTPANLAFTYSATTQGHLPDASAFGAIILRSNADGSALRLADVSRIELGSLDYSFSATLNGEPTVPIGIYLQPGANALDAITAVRERMEELSKRFPEHLTYSIPFDTTQFVRLSINEVIHTFLEAMVLVMLVVFLFLQNWRATLIPLIAVPVSIIGAFAGIYALGFSINMLTLFGLVLAIGIVVDDAIVVLENVERLMVSESLSPKDAAIKAMSEVTTPVIAIVLVLCAVFVPVAFMGGLAGQMYKQFAVTIAVSVVISGFVALTLTPALCALILKPGHREVAAPFRWFNRAFDRLTDGYAGGVAFFLRRAALALALFMAMIAVTAVMFARTPTGLVPNEDQGYLFAVGMLPPAASLSRTEAAMAQASTIIRSNPAVSDVISLSGLDLIGGGLKSNAGAAFITLKDWSERKGPAEDSRALAADFMGSLSGIKDALMLTFSPPPIMGMSNTGGFELYVQDRGGAGPAALMAATEKLVQAAAARPDLAGVRTTFAIDVPQYRLDVDRDQAKALGVPINAIFDAMQSTFGSLYVNDFTVLGRNFRVMLQSEAQYREAIEDVRHVFVRAAGGSMIPLDTFLKARRVVGPDSIGRFNGFVSAKLIGEPGPGHSSGEAIKAMGELAAQALPEGFALAWSGSAYQEISEQGSGSTALIIGMVMVLLILAAQFERWSLPFAVILAVPFAVFGALVAISLRGLENDLYFQIGLVALIGLAAKNAILIVEFASLKQKEGLSAADAALSAARLRFRPIVMTSLAFILGCVPLAISTGVGAASRHAIGTGVIGGMLAATAIAIFFIPLFYRLIVSLRAPRPETPAAPAAIQPHRP